MTLSKRQEANSGNSPAPWVTSRALEWLWQQLSLIRHPHFLECDLIHKSTLDVLLRRGAKLYVTDLISPAVRQDAAFWSRQGKTLVFLAGDFLGQIPEIPADSISAIICWGLLDLLPREALPATLERFHAYLQPGGVLFCILREPSLAAGAETRWWFENLTVLRSGNGDQKPFPYPAVTNREMERLFPGGNVKTFLTRSGRREVLGIK